MSRASRAILERDETSAHMGCGSTDHAGLAARARRYPAPRLGRSIISFVPAAPPARHHAAWRDGSTTVARGPAALGARCRYGGRDTAARGPGDDAGTVQRGSLARSQAALTSSSHTARRGRCLPSAVCPRVTPLGAGEDATATSDGAPSGCSNGSARAFARPARCAWSHSTARCCARREHSPVPTPASRAARSGSWSAAATGSSTPQAAALL